ncbi:MAG: hypothetical protein QXV69_06870 [Sulfolobaceae archaeon]
MSEKSISIDELKKYIENKINEVDKEKQYYEYLLYLLENCEHTNFRGSKGQSEIIKNRRGEIIAEVIFTPPLLKIQTRKELSFDKRLINPLYRILEEEKMRNNIDYKIRTETKKAEGNKEIVLLKEIIIENVKDFAVYRGLKDGIQAFLERHS